ncbi:MAG TPA: prepilin-type N-terminal cleavage/methylation domain-containing protein [Opitutaceae bacterium]|nr:prepilin-type N-terminal cleavage/methylation domain-containing protein [Opitutaceae bacterium]
MLVSRPTLPWTKTGFTLVELLTGLAILSVLVSVGAGVKAGLDRRVLESRARAELTLLAQVLESYAYAYGDYPWTGDCPPLSLSTLGDGVVNPDAAEVKLFNALMGRLNPQLQRFSGAVRLEVARFSLLHSVPEGNSFEGEALSALLDPWGRPYVYQYRGRSEAKWRLKGYVLYSKGPDGLDTPGMEGNFDENLEPNLDNVYPPR